MKVYILAMILPGLLVFSNQTFGQDQSFVQVKNGHFNRDGKPYKFLGANYWYGMYLGMKDSPGDRARLERELDQLASLGVKSLRVLGSSEGQGQYQITPTLLNKNGEYNESVFEGLDFFLNALKEREMMAVVVLNNFWMWSGGMPQYVSWTEGSEIPLPDIENGGTWDPFINYSLKFFENNHAQKMYLRHLKKIVNRKNSISGIKYKNDPTILSWQLANEPRGYSKQDEYREWIRKTSKFLDKKDRKHMISLGAEGNTASELSGTDLYLDNDFKEIDYATVHVWIQNWSWYDPKNVVSFAAALDNTQDYLTQQLQKAKELSKPVVIEEFGVSRDNAAFDGQSTTTYRDKFYNYMFDFTYESVLNNGLVQGCNFWSWGGEGRPSLPGGIWRKSDDLIGDPPHERQGWYSVYDSDYSTIEIIKFYADRINAINE